MRTDIVLVNFDMAPDLVRCLNTLGHWPHGMIWVVNNSAQAPESSADTALLRSTVLARTDATLLDAGTNLGFGRACNLAFSHSQAECVLLLNPDARIETDGLLQLMAWMKSHPQWGAISPGMCWNDSRSFLIPPTVKQTPLSCLSLALSTRWAWWARWRAGQELRRSQRLSEKHSICKVDFLSGAVLLVRREAAQMAAKSAGLNEGDLFDPGYFMFFEDSDLSVRLRRTGWSLGVHTGIHATHHYRHKPYKAALMQQAREYYFKHRFPRFFRWSADLKWVDALSKSVEAGHRFEVIHTPLHSATAFTEQTHGAAVLALSPSLLAWPAVYHSGSRVASTLDDKDWALLEPGQYVALLQDRVGKVRWCCFSRSAAMGPSETM
jgi:GT2 family glycosyltransferase